MIKVMIIEVSGIVKILRMIKALSIDLEEGNAAGIDGGTLADILV